MVLRSLRTLRVLPVLAAVLAAGVILALSLRPRSGEAVAVWNETRQLPYHAALEVRKTSALASGYSIILNEGRPGVKKVLFSYERRASGRLAARIFGESVLKKAVPGRVLVGRSPYPNPAYAPRTTRVLKSILLKATAYTPGAEDNGAAFAGITAMGWPAGYGMVAVDPSIIPLRSLVYVEGYGYAWAGDTGGAIKGNRIDLCFPTREKADAYGVRKTRVYLLGRVHGSRPLMASADLFPRQYMDREALRFQGIKPYEKLKAGKAKIR